MRERFIDKNLRPDSLAIVEIANRIIAEYREQGYILTLRQLYYQFVARDLIQNSERSYKRLGSIISDGRLLGYIDWEAIEDRTRNLDTPAHWSSPRAIIKAAVQSYAIDKWEDQPCRVEVWIEKEALAGVIAGVCEELDIPHFSCRGYVSQSEQWRAGKRFEKYIAEDQKPIVLHLGDHDPSGIDMTRDNKDRLRMFAYQGVEVRRLALNYDQVEQYGPPPNPAKLSDTRADDYINRFGYESWELDALEPSVITQLIRDAVADIVDPDLYQDRMDLEAEQTETLRSILDGLED